MEIEYDKPIAVTPEQYHRIMRDFRERVAGRVDENGQHWIKLWIMAEKERLEIALNIKS